MSETHVDFKVIGRAPDGRDCLFDPVSRTWWVDSKLFAWLRKKAADAEIAGEEFPPRRWVSKFGEGPIKLKFDERGVMTIPRFPGQSI